MTKTSVATVDVAVVELVHRVRREHHQQLRAAFADQLGVAPQRVRGARVPAAAVVAPAAAAA
jgi:hypothetical protein